ncbi:hypothetical protein V6N11_052916 [Hibiscus sabdariffa]|uniref:Uncharacterized protein n=1 Tax=Hibiscus sabdariffa TaxID=183260 RepID=A0ABR2UBF6_9ROSI
MAMASANALCMNPGDKDISYANHSSLQKNILLKVRPFLEDTITDMLNKILPVTCIKVADLGCASGSNAFVPTNDFNTVFRSVPDFKTDKEDLREPCFIAEVTGSFTKDTFQEGACTLYILPLVFIGSQRSQEDLKTTRATYTCQSQVLLMYSKLIRNNFELIS